MQCPNTKAQKPDLCSLEAILPHLRCYRCCANGKLVQAVGNGFLKPFGLAAMNSVSLPCPLPARAPALFWSLPEWIGILRTALPCLSCLVQGLSIVQLVGETACRKSDGADKPHISFCWQAYCLSGSEQWTRDQTSAPQVHVACKEPDLPFPVLVGCVAPKGDIRKFHCYEFTPLYSGCPAIINDTPEIAIGGVLVEPFGSNCRAPGLQLPSHGSEAMLDLDVEWRVPLVQAAGISSSYIAQMKADASKEGLWEAMGCPELHIFNGIDGQGAEMPFADGGGVDNTAIHAALRRGVSKVLACYANGRPLEPEVFWDVAALFGAVPEGKQDFEGPKMGGGVIPAAVFNKHIQVRRLCLCHYIVLHPGVATSTPTVSSGLCHDLS